MYIFLNIFFDYISCYFFKYLIWRHNKILIFFLLFKYILDFMIFYLIKNLELLIYYPQKLFKKYYVKSNNHLGLELVNRIARPISGLSIRVMSKHESLDSLIF